MVEPRGTMAKVLDLALLRKEAEARLPGSRSRGAGPKTATVEDLRTLRHELDVHRVELEMQNEELRRANAELERAQDRYRDLYDFAPVGYFTISPAGTVEDANLTGAALLGCHRSWLIDRPFAFFVAPGHGVAWRRLVAQVRRADGSRSDTIEMRRRDGRRFTAQVACQGPGPGEERAILRVAVTDVTEQRRLEAEAAEHEARLEVVQAHPVPLLLAHRDGTVVSVNDALTRALGYVREEVPTLVAWHRRVYPDPAYRREVLAAAEANLPVGSGPGEPFTAERRVTARDGAVRHMQVSRVRVGEYLLVSLVDVTDRKLAEDQVRSSEAWFRKLADDLSVGLFYAEMDGTLRFVNRTLLSMLGWTREQVSHREFGERLHPDDRGRVMTGIEAAKRNAAPWTDEFRVVHPGGRVAWLRGHVEPSRAGDRVTGALGVLVDVTDRVTFEERLRERDALLDAIVEGSVSGIVVFGEGGKVLRANRIFRELWGISEEVLARGADAMLEVVLERVRDPEAFLRAAERPHLSPEPTRDEVELRDGRVLERMSRPFPFGGPEGRLCAFRDVSRERQAEEAVRKGHQFLRTVLETTRDGYAVVGPDGVIRDVNAALCEMIGCGTETLVGRRIWTLEDGTEPQAAERLARAAADGFARFETRLRHQDGRPVDVDVSLSRLPGDEGLFVGFARDRTAEKRLESQLAVASRLGAMSSLVAGLAHEINNPLAATVASLDVALKDARRAAAKIPDSGATGPSGAGADLGDLLECIGDAREGADRIKGIVQQLVLYGRPAAHRCPVRLLDTVQAAARLLPAHLAARAEVLVEGDGQVTVHASPSQIELLVANLLANAAQAIPEGRRGHVVARVAMVDPRTACLEVSDDGVGMDAAQRARAFDPFFTTREPGEGMGLGLPICQAIAMANGGSLLVTSSPERGSTFRLELPRPDAG